jgi:hypothetical protein
MWSLSLTKAHVKANNSNQLYPNFERKKRGVRLWVFSSPQSDRVNES